MPAKLQDTAKLDPASAPLEQSDWNILNNVPQAIRRGGEIKDWWAEHEPTRVRMNRFPLARQFRQATDNYGCLMEADLPSGSLKLAGVIQEQRFAARKSPRQDKAGALEVANQLREFVMRHFMHVTSLQPLFRSGDAPDAALRDRRGWGYEQAYYKLAGSGLVGKFSPVDRKRIGSLLDIGPGATYEWIVFSVHIYNLALPFDLTGSADGPMLTMRTRQVVHTVLTHDYLVDETATNATSLSRLNPTPGGGPKVVGRYGYGYSVVPDSGGNSLLAAGPGQLTNTIETLHFTALDNGEVRARMVFLMPQAPRILNVSPVEWTWELADRLTLNLASRMFSSAKELMGRFEPRLAPIFMGLRLADMVTLGMAGDEFSLRQDDLYKSIMFAHLADVHGMFNIAGTHFSMVRDWTDLASLPEWASPAVDRIPAAPRAQAAAA